MTQKDERRCKNDMAIIILIGVLCLILSGDLTKMGGRGMK